MSFHNARLIRGDLADKPVVTGRLHTKRGSLCDRSEQSKHSLQGPGSLVATTDGETGNPAKGRRHVSGEVQVWQGSGGPVAQPSLSIEGWSSEFV